MDWIEIIGYIGMALILCSFIFKKIQVIRTVNMIGSIFSLIYGIFTRTWPTAILNAALFTINAVYMTIFLIRLKKK